MFSGTDIIGIYNVGNRGVEKLTIGSHSVVCFIQRVLDTIFVFVVGLELEVGEGLGYTVVVELRNFTFSIIISKCQERVALPFCRNVAHLIDAGNNRNDDKFKSVCFCFSVLHGADTT